ncbi:MAG: hypothetical protein AAF617_14950, partial [Bacteroidota bacterium]
VIYKFRCAKENKRGWRTRSLGRDDFSYQQKIDNEWKEITIEAELLVGKISRVIYFKAVENWSDYPEWAQDRDEIIQRIKIEYPPHQTEYEND